MAIQLTILNNYLFITDTTTVYNDVKSLFRFQFKPDNSFDVIYNGIKIYQDKTYNDFVKFDNTPFASVDDFKEFYTSEWETSAATSGLTDIELRATPVDVNVTNQIDLSGITTLLTDAVAYLQSVDENTDTQEAQLSQVIDEISGSSTVNSGHLTNVIAALQTLDTNTDGIETTLSSILSKIIASPATEATLSALNAKVAVRKASSATQTRVQQASLNTNTTLLASNVNRIKAIITNNVNTVLLVKLGANASATSYTIALGLNDSWVEENYTGIIDAISTAAIDAQVNEM